MIFRGVPYTLGINGERIYEVMQNNEAWDNLRCGIPTASEFDRILRQPKKGGGYTAQSLEKIERYAALKCAELVLGGKADKAIYARAMEVGSEREVYATMMYERQFGVQTRRVGFVTDPNHWYGVSPDRDVIGQKKAVEIKAPDPDTHIMYAYKPELLKEEYYFQTQGHLFVRKAIEVVDNYSYHPRIKAVNVPITRDETYQIKLAEDMEYFRGVMDKIAADLIKKGYLKV